MKPEVIIDGYWLSALMPWGDLEWTTCWPGGTESITFGVARDHHLFRPDALVELDYGGIRLAVGALVEPTRGEPLMVEGLHRQAEEYAALDASNEVAISVHEAVDQAIVRGWSVVRGADGVGSPFDLSPEPLVRGMPRLDPDRPHSVAQYLDQSAIERGHLWGVDADGVLVMREWSTLPTTHMLPGLDGLGVSRDGYASALVGRFLNSFDSVFYTSFREDTAATDRWGYAERTIAEPLGEGAPMSSAQALEILAGLQGQGRSQIGWTSSIEVQHGDVVTEHGQPVDLNRIGRPGEVIRLHGLDLDVADLSGRTWIDVPIARTRHKDGTVTIEPRGLSSPMNDALAGV